MTKHEWRDKTEDGEWKYYRAIHHAGNWEYFSTLKSDPEWYPQEMLTLEEMEELRKVLWNKHLRRRLPLKHVEQIDGFIEELREEQVDSSSEEE